MYAVIGGVYTLCRNIWLLYIHRGKNYFYLVGRGCRGDYADNLFIIIVGPHFTACIYKTSCGFSTQKQSGKVSIE